MLSARGLVDVTPTGPNSAPLDNLNHTQGAPVCPAL
jgi:hypothetical protein